MFRHHDNVNGSLRDIAGIYQLTVVSRRPGCRTPRLKLTGPSDDGLGLLLFGALDA